MSKTRTKSHSNVDLSQGPIRQALQRMTTYQVIIPVGGCVVLHREIPSGASTDETLDMIELDTDNLSFDTDKGHFDLLVDSGSLWIVDHQPIVSVAGQVIVNVPYKKTIDIEQLHEAALQTVKDLSFDFDDVGHFDLRIKENDAFHGKSSQESIRPQPRYN